MAEHARPVAESVSLAAATRAERLLPVIVAGRWWVLGGSLAIGLLLGLRVGPRPALGADLFVLAVLGPVLSLLDLRLLRLPDPVVLPGAAALAMLLVFAAAVERGGWARLEQAALGSAVTGVLLGLLACALGDALGWGDVKAGALLLAPVTAWQDWVTLLWAGLLAFGAAAAVLVLRPSRGRRIALGPFLFLGALLAICSRVGTP